MFGRRGRLPREVNEIRDVGEAKQKQLRITEGIPCRWYNYERSCRSNIGTLENTEFLRQEQFEFIEQQQQQQQFPFTESNEFR